MIDYAKLQQRIADTHVNLTSLYAKRFLRLNQELQSKSVYIDDIVNGVESLLDVLKYLKQVPKNAEKSRFLLYLYLHY